MMSKLSSTLFAFVALQAAWLQPASIAAATLLPGFAGDASNGSSVECGLNVTSLPWELAGQEAMAAMDVDSGDESGDESGDDSA